MERTKIISIVPAPKYDAKGMMIPTEVLQKSDLVLGWDKKHSEYKILKDREGNHTTGMSYNRHSLDYLISDERKQKKRKDINKTELKNLLTRMYKLGWCDHTNNGPYIAVNRMEDTLEEFINTL